MAEKEDRDKVTGLVVGGIGGAALAATIAMLIAARPAAAAPPEEKLDYLIEVLTTLVPVLAEVSERQATLIELLEQLLTVPAEGRALLTVAAPYRAKDPEQIFSKAILSAGTFYSDKMVNWANGKRILFKVESSLNQAVNIQLIGNVQDTKELATDINGVLPCTANGNISVGLAWDDWHPYVGVRITVAEVPTAGILTISAVIQE
ncbi:hypothetical protein ES703_110739 [subsurface metagenome]